MRITATDDRGLAATMTRRLNPASMRVVFGTNPGGLRYSVNGRERIRRHGAQRLIAGAQVQLDAPRRQYRNGLLWRFQRWPYNRPLSHTLTLPRRSGDYVYKATFVPVRHQLRVTTYPAGLRFSANRGNRRGSYTARCRSATGSAHGAAHPALPRLPLRLRAVVRRRCALAHLPDARQRRGAPGGLPPGGPGLTDVAQAYRAATAAARAP